MTMPIGLSNSWEDALFSSLEQISVAMYNEAASEGQMSLKSGVSGVS